MKMGGGGVTEVGEGRFEDNGVDVTAVGREGDGDGRAEACAEENQVLGLVWVTCPQVVEDLIEVLAFPVAGGGDLAARFAVGAQVEGEDIVAQLEKHRRPSDGADLRVGVAVE